MKIYKSKTEYDSLASYRNYYNKAKTGFANWTGKLGSRSVPEWYTGV